VVTSGPTNPTNPNTPANASIDVAAYAQRILAGDRATVARAITLVESTRADHRLLAQELLVRLLPHTGRAHRVGITGVPGAGKSTFIDELGTQLTTAGHKVAVLAVDPSSTRHGGSILGDKTRMARLATDPNAYVRPSPSSGSLGGVTRSTREAMVVVEAAGFDVVLVETVGVGQSETTVADMVDCFLVLMVARTGDALQGIKRGVLELADIITVNKADGDHVLEAERAARELADALHLFEPISPSWHPPVLTCSGLEGNGVARVWQTVEAHHHALSATGELTTKRRRQQIDWMWSMVHDRLIERVHGDPAVRRLADELTSGIEAGTTTAALAAEAILAAVSQATQDGPSDSSA
jgi:LAO/AO transport system kinase